MVFQMLQQRALTPLQKRRKLLADEYRKFFSTKNFEGGGEPFSTYLRWAKSSNRRRILEIDKKIRALVPNAKQHIAVEFGPGFSPMLPGHPFKECIYVEGSAKIAAALRKKGLVAKKDRVVVGNIRKIPLPENMRAGIIVVNEVLTHIRPKERAGILQEIEKRADALLIIDRPLKTAEEPAEGISKLEANLRRAGLIDFGKVADFLKGRGWQHIALGKVESGDKTEYVILTAKRKEL